MKAGLKRKNALHNPRHAGANFFASAYLRHSPGLAGLGKVVAHWLKKTIDRVDPHAAWQHRKQSLKDASAPALVKRKRGRQAAGLKERLQAPQAPLAALGGCIAEGAALRA